MSDVEWLHGLLHKNPATVMAVVGRLMEVGMEMRQFTVNDLAVYPDQKGAVGAAMKVMRCLGFEKDGSTLPSFRHQGKTVDVWVLTDSRKAEAFLEYQLQYIVTVLKQYEEKP